MPLIETPRLNGRALSGEHSPETHPRTVRKLYRRAVPQVMRTYRYYPNAEQRDNLARTWVYNWGLERRTDAYHGRAGGELGRRFMNQSHDQQRNEQSATPSTAATRRS